MKLFHFYLDKSGDKILFPYFRNSLGYGIFYLCTDGYGNVIDSFEFKNADVAYLRAYFENNKCSIENYDNNQSRFGYAKLKNVDKLEYKRIVLQNVFLNRNIIDAINTWSNIR